MPWCHTQYSLADAVEWVRVTKEGRSHNSMYEFLIEADGRFAGSCGINHINLVDGVANIGYWVAEPFWGRGIATAAVEFISEYALRTFPLDRLQASVFDWNPASARVLEKAGFTLEGRQRRTVVKDGRVGDLLLYARLAAG